jgi:magnesium transporter
MPAETTSRAMTRLERLREALEVGKLRPVQRLVNSLHPAEIASLLESLPPDERDVVWELVAPENDGDVLLELGDEVRAALLKEMDEQEIVAATDGMDVDDLADFIGELPEQITQRVLRSMDRQDRDRLQDVIELLAYPEDSAGGLMNTDTVTVRPDVTLDVVLRYLRLRGGLPEKTDALFVVNRRDRYLGNLYLTDLLTEDVASTVAEIMDTEARPMPASLGATEVAKHFEDRDLLSAAVVSDTGQLLGRITIDDVVDVIREQGEHSLMSMAGLDEDEDMFAPVVTSARRRAIWLGVNLATAFLAAWVVGLFKATLDKVVVLAILMPVVASMGGIAGSQTLTLIIRGLALGQVERSNAQWLLIKELSVGLLNGAAWAVVVGATTYLWFGDWEVAMVISVAMVVNLFVAALAGVGIPLVLQRLRIDPALAGGVVLTTVTDVIGFTAFLGLGAIVLT